MIGVKQRMATKLEILISYDDGNIHRRNRRSSNHDDDRDKHNNRNDRDRSISRKRGQLQILSWRKYQPK